MKNSKKTKSEIAILTLFFLLQFSSVFLKIFSFQPDPHEEL